MPFLDALDAPLTTGLDADVRLRSLTEADADVLAAMVEANLDRLSEFLAWPATARTPEGALSMITPYLEQRDGRRVLAGIWADDQLVGGIAVFRHDPAAATIELGCWVVAAAEGRGVVRAACVEALRLVRSWGVERVQWNCDPANTRSSGLALRLGFSYEGTLRSSYPVEGRRTDTAVYGLVEGEIDRALT